MYSVVIDLFIIFWSWKLHFILCSLTELVLLIRKAFCKMSDAYYLNIYIYTLHLHINPTHIQLNLLHRYQYHSKYNSNSTQPYIHICRQRFWHRHYTQLSPHSKSRDFCRTLLLSVRFHRRYQTFACRPAIIYHQTVTLTVPFIACTQLIIIIIISAGRRAPLGLSGGRVSAEETSARGWLLRCCCCSLLGPNSPESILVRL